MAQQVLKQTSKQVLKQSVGLDVSKDTVAACFSQQEIGKPFRILSNRTFSINAAGFKQLDEWIVRQYDKTVPLHLLMEATGVYYEELAYFLQGKNYRLSVLLPNKTSAYAKTLDYKTKNDKIDAKKLAQMSLERELLQWTPPNDTMLKIKRLCRERTELTDEKVAFKNRLHAKTHAHAPLAQSSKRAKSALKFLAQQIKEIEREINKTVNDDPDIKQRMDKVCSIKGVGLISAATIVAEANGFVLFKNKAQLVSFAGYDVVENKSGTSIESKTKISKRGNHRIRKALHFPALVAVKHETQFKNLYDRVFGASKIKMKAYVAVQRKLLVLIYTLYKNNAVFNANFEAELAEKISDMAVQPSTMK
jgi:transposase